ncbi:MAG: DUF1343 domain-containing protein, partial [Candidatus Omnitrophica bacterium]|nr:DUF1343 domain-containing protein [Candidatus Omnitrophota bacterium]
MKKLFGLFFAGLVCLMLPGRTFSSEMPNKPSVKLGVEVLVEKRLDLIKGKKVGLITNRSGTDSRLNSSIDLIYGIPGVKLVALYAPEHGIRGGLMGEVENETDQKTGIPVFSLYGKTKRPTRQMLKDVEVLLFDIQDIGSRSYTYITTLKYCMEEAAKNQIPVIILDRPNPVNGLLIDGPALNPEFESFIGAGPLAYLHGMTIGEVGRYLNKEMQINCDLEVVLMEGWKRSMSWRDTGLVWTPTSPHIPEMDSAWFYPVTGILGELSVVSVGVGYTLPFKIIGAPWMDAEKIAQELNKRRIPGVYFQPFSFVPFYNKFKDEPCNGFRIIIRDETVFRPVATGYHIIDALLK